MLPPDNKSPVSIEDLLRLKTAERPNAEFWSHFEKELRQKQLTALVRKRRWWHDVPILLSRRVYMPAGAAAIVAFTLVTVRYANPGSVAQVENTAPQIVAADPAIESLPATEVIMTTPSGEHSEIVADAPRPVTRDQPSAAMTASGGDLAIVAGLVPVQLSANASSDSPSARSIAANLARLEQAEPDLLNAVMGSRLSSARVMAASADLEPDDSLDSSAQRYRLIARYADQSLSPEPAAPALLRERIARRLGDDVNDRISRIGVEGGRVSLKF